MVNFVKAMLRFQDFAARRNMGGNDVMLFLAIFRVLNDRRWPVGMQEISNNELLVHTSFTGSGRDNTLREARRRLAALGLIRFTPGDRRAKQPEYAINWAALGIREEEDTAMDSDTGFGYENIPKNDGKEAAHTNYRTPENIYNYPKRRGKQKGPRRAFAPPTVEEVRTYCGEIGLQLNPLKFLDYYGARGWPIEDWRAALRCWKIREDEERQRRGGYSTQRRYTEAELEARAGEL
jgi:hypothetical protein